MLKVPEITSFVTETEYEFSFAHEFPFQEAYREKGKLYCVFSFRKEAQREPNELIKEILTSLFVQYFRNSKLQPFNALKSTVSITKRNFNEITSLCAVSTIDTIVYVAGVGGAGMSIYRNGGYSKILVSKDEVVTASGYSKLGDILIQATHEFYKSLSDTDAVALLKSGDESKIKQFLSENSSSASIACNIFSFGKPQKSSIPSMIDTSNLTTPMIPTDTSNVEESKSRFSLSGGIGFFRNTLNVMKINTDNVTYEVSDTIKKQRRMTMSIGIIVIIMLGVSIGFGMYQNRKEENLARYEPRLLEAQHNYDEALSVASLSVDRAREHFQTSRQIIDSLIAEGIVDERITVLDENLRAKRGEILGEYQQTTQIFHDLSILTDDFSGTDMVVSDEVIYVLDKETRKALSIEIPTKRSEVFAGPGSIDSSIKAIAATSGRVYSLTGEGIVRIDSQRQDVVESPISNSVLFGAYNANLYVLDKSNSQIYRYSATDGGFADPAPWLSESIQPDLSKITSIAIDGSFWMVSETGGVFKFEVGNQVNYSITGLSPVLSNPTRIYTNDELENVYILEPSQQRVVVLTKSGQFVSQHVAPELQNAQDFGVSKTENLILFLVGEKIFSLSLTK